MKEKELRRWHKRIGIILALLLVLQGGTGLIFTFKNAFKVFPVSSENISVHHKEKEHNNSGEHSQMDSDHDLGNSEGSHEHDHGEGVIAAFATIHHGGGLIGFVYRLITGLGILWMAGTGILIYSRIKAREKNV